MVFGIGASLYKAIVPPKLPPPTVAFGPLPAIKFPTPVTNSQLTYSLETATGGLPSSPEQLPIYYIKPSAASLFSAESANEKARALGFTGQPNQLSQTMYEFIHPSLPKTMEINIVTGEYSISYNLASDRSPLTGVPPAEDTAVSNAKSILSTAKSMPEDMAEGPAKIEYLKVRDQQLVPALSLSDASLTRVNFFRKDFGTEESPYPSVTAVPGRGNIWTLLSGDKDRSKQLVAAEYHYYEVDEEQSATYPLKSARDAYQELTSGGGYIASYNSAGGTSAKIQQVYLAYYDPNVPSEFYQPVFVFTGSNNLVAYVPAVDKEYYGVE